MANCPDRIYLGESSIYAEEEPDEGNHHITLFESNLITEAHMKMFMSENFSCAILDCGASASVAGKIWMDCYCDSLPQSERDSLCFEKSDNTFKFGSEETFKSIYNIPLDSPNNHSPLATT